MKRQLLKFFLLAGIITCLSCRPGVVITERPGPPAYARPTLPGPGYVWVDGDWRVVGGRYQWREGYWAPARRKAWTSGQWAPRKNGWYWKRGHWR